MDESRTPVWQHLVMTLVSAVGMGVIVWLELPGDQRMWLTLEAKSKMLSVLHRAAPAAGRAGMGQELRDHAPSAVVSYRAAYWLSRLRDAVTR